MTQDPFEFFLECFNQAKSLNLPQYNSVTLVTATPDAKPSARIVLLKGIQDGSFRFFTNYNSRKSGELISNPQAQILFYRPEFGRQIRVEGRVSKVSAADSDEYWFTRSRESRIGAIASQQSSELKSMDELRARVAEVEKQFEGREVPRPENWGGFALTPEYFEFWEDGAHRLHERITYTREGSGWRTNRLFP